MHIFLLLSRNKNVVMPRCVCVAFARERVFFIKSKRLTGYSSLSSQLHKQNVLPMFYTEQVVCNYYAYRIWVYLKESIRQPNIDLSGKYKSCIFQRFSDSNDKTFISFCTYSLAKFYNITIEHTSKNHPTHKTKQN